MEQKRDMYWWWVKYLTYCKIHKIGIEKYQEYTKTMEKVREWVNQNDLLSQN